MNFFLPPAADQWPATCFTSGSARCGLHQHNLGKTSAMITTRHAPLHPARQLSLRRQADEGGRLGQQREYLITLLAPLATCALLTLLLLALGWTTAGLLVAVLGFLYTFGWAALAFTVDAQQP